MPRKGMVAVMKLTQQESNPFPFSDSNKRYYTYSYYMKQTFGGKCVKIPLDGGFTCPNIDGSRGKGGCIYCAGGSGARSTMPIEMQYAAQRAMLAQKWAVCRCIPYFQAYTGTYAPLDVLRDLYERALALPDAVGLAIGTRADCLPDDVLALLAEISERTHLTVELGLQSSSDATAARIHRGHTWSEFVRGYTALRRIPGVRIGVHLILGLPGEGKAEMEATARAVAALHPDEVKLHLMHVLRGTPLADLWASGAYTPLTMDEYVRAVIDTLELLPPDTVIGRVTGDGEADALLAPLWSRKKVAVMNEIDKMMFRENTWQGKRMETASNV